MYFSSSTLPTAAASIFYISALAQGLIEPSAETTAACQAISQGSAETQIYPAALTNADYLDAKTHWWSAANADLTPACVVFPTTAEEVSYVVKVLLEYPTVEFSVKSGGHNTNVGFASVNWGVLISFSHLASTTISADHTTADVSPGARWESVISTLEPYGVAVVGGRIGDVGAGGLLLGGGLSFLSAQYGLACDNVVNYEVVLANSTIVNANAKNNTDLFWALKGGGNQFGIVTKFTLKTVPIGLVWGGTRVYDITQFPTLINATQHFIQESEDSKAAIIVTLDVAVETLARVAVVFYFYDGATPGSIFDEFNSFVPIEDDVSTQNFSSLVISNNQYSIYGLRYLYRTTALPNLPGTYGTDLYNAIYNNWANYILAQDTLLPGFVFSIAYQPMTAQIASASVAAGGDALQLDPGNGDRVWIDLAVSWETALGDDIAASTAQTMINDMDSYAQAHYAGVKNTRYVEGNLTYAEYDPLFMNDAMYDQNPAQTYGNNSYQRLKMIQKTVDPNGFFSTRTGGFKYN